MIWIYFLIINGSAFLMFLGDKQRAIHHMRRIPESVLLSSVLLGGSIGAYLSMLLFHHKTKKGLFLFGIPLIMIGQLYMYRFLLF